MSWLFIPDLERPSWERSSVEAMRSNPKLSSRIGIMPWPISSRTWNRDGYLQFLSGMTLQPSMLYRGLNEWISSSPTSPIWDLKTSHPIWEAYWSHLDLPVLSWSSVPKFSPHETDLLLSVADYNRWISSYLSQKSQRRTSDSSMEESDYLWSSPLLTKGAMWPTPGNREWKGGAGWERTLKKLKQGKGPDSLATATRLWIELKDSSINYPSLPHQGIQTIGSSSWSHGPISVPHSQSRLMATFTEWLMGYPIGWSVCGS